jgi:hypothetical protein
MFMPKRVCGHFHVLTFYSEEENEEYEMALKVHSNALKMYVFILHWFVTLYEKDDIATAAKTTTTKKVGIINNIVTILGWSQSCQENSCRSRTMERKSSHRFDIYPRK